MHSRLLGNRFRLFETMAMNRFSLVYLIIDCVSVGRLYCSKIIGLGVRSIRGRF